jgi:HSP20 family protein
MQRRSRNYGVSHEMQPLEDRWTVLIRHMNRAFSPPTDVIELADKMVIVVEIAGMRSSDLEITLLERHLVISGMRERPQYPNPAYHQVEIAYGEFRIDVTLPWAVNREAVSATYEAGFLQIALPRKTVKTIRIEETNGAD